MRAMLLLLICCLVSSFTLPAVAAQPSRVGTDLGLVELPVAQASSAPMVVFMSGDGGWAALDKGLGAELQRHGMPVVGWSSLSYYWKKKTPDQATADLVRILTEYQSRWGRQRWLLVGFSFGAEIVPFVINRLPPAYRDSLVGAVMLSPWAAIPPCRRSRPSRACRCSACRGRMTTPRSNSARTCSSRMSPQ